MKRKHGKNVSKSKKLLSQQIKLRAFKKAERKKLKKNPIWD